MSVGNSKFFLVAFAFAPVQSGVIPSRFPPAIVFFFHLWCCLNARLILVQCTCFHILVAFLKCWIQKILGFKTKKYGWCGSARMTLDTSHNNHQKSPYHQYIYIDTHNTWWFLVIIDIIKSPIIITNNTPDYRYLISTVQHTTQPARPQVTHCSALGSWRRCHSSVWQPWGPLSGEAQGSLQAAVPGDSILYAYL